MLQKLPTVKSSKATQGKVLRRLSSTTWTLLLALAYLSLGGCALGAAKSKAANDTPAKATRATKTTAWQEKGGSSVLCISADRLILAEPGTLKVLGLERRDLNSWSVRKDGLLETWSTVQGKGSLKIEAAGRSREYRLRRSAPRECDLKPFPLGKAVKLAPERARAIEEEIVRRLQVDQKAGRAARAGGPSADAVIADNTEYLRGLLREVGWVDNTRFRSPASGNAVILVQHSRDLSLMMAALPFVESDFKTSPDGNQVYAVLYDRVQILLGRKQRYGSQLNVDAAGNPMVLPLEDPARVEEFRKEIGLSSLADYFEMAKELFPGKTIRMPRLDE